MFPHFIPFVRIVLAILVPLSFHIEFRLTLTMSIKHLVEILIEIALNLYISLGNVCQLDCVPPIYGYRISLHLFRSPLISFISVV